VLLHSKVAASNALAHDITSWTPTLKQHLLITEALSGCKYYSISMVQILFNINSQPFKQTHHNTCLAMDRVP
jgi:hypothetical protein